MVVIHQFDGKIPNLALLRIAMHHRALGHEIRFRKSHRFAGEFDPSDTVYASLIFQKTRPVAEELLRVHPTAIIGGTGWDETLKLEDVGITTQELDYSIAGGYRHSIGFTQRGCRLKCPFCVVPRKEGSVREESTIAEIWRGDPYPRNILLLDNDFFGQPNWRDRVRELRDGNFNVSFNQGINARFLNEETAEAMASLHCMDDQFKDRRIYTAWDNKGDWRRLFTGLNYLRRAGVAPSSIMVYMLIGYWPNEDHSQREIRRLCLRHWGAMPYPMPFKRIPHKGCACHECEAGRELVGYQRWVVAGYDKRVSWKDFKANRYQPNGISYTEPPLKITRAI